MLCGGTGEVGTDELTKEAGSDFQIIDDPIPGSADPVRDEEYFEHGHSSPHNPPNAIPDSADLESEENISTDSLAKIRQIIPIAPGSKYVLTVDATVTSEDMDNIQGAVRNWWEGDEKFLIVSDQIQFHRVDDDEEIPELAWCGAENCPGHDPSGSWEQCDEEKTNNTLPPGPVT
jgi:hypothetical protein